MGLKRGQTDESSVKTNYSIYVVACLSSLSDGWFVCRVHTQTNYLCPSLSRLIILLDRRHYCILKNTMSSKVDLINPQCRMWKTGRHLQHFYMFLEKDPNIQTKAYSANAWEHRQIEYFHVVLSRKRRTGAETGCQTKIFGMFNSLCAQNILETWNNMTWKSPFYYRIF